MGINRKLKPYLPDQKELGRQRSTEAVRYKDLAPYISLLKRPSYGMIGFVL